MKTVTHGVQAAGHHPRAVLEEVRSQLRAWERKRGGENSAVQMAEKKHDVKRQVRRTKETGLEARGK